MANYSNRIRRDLLKYGKKQYAILMNTTTVHLK